MTYEPLPPRVDGEPLPPHVSARLDQVRGVLRDLVGSVRQHNQTVCEYPGVCPGERVIRWQETNSPHDVAAVLSVALVELANQPGWQKAGDR